MVGEKEGYKGCKVKGRVGGWYLKNGKGLWIYFFCYDLCMWIVYFFFFYWCEWMLLLCFFFWIKLGCFWGI